MTKGTQVFLITTIFAVVSFVLMPDTPTVAGDLLVYFLWVLAVLLVYVGVTKLYQKYRK
jgi:hypothetical protein